MQCNSTLTVRNEGIIAKMLWTCSRGVKFESSCSCQRLSPSEKDLKIFWVMVGWVIRKENQREREKNKDDKSGYILSVSGPSARRIRLPDTEKKTSLRENDRSGVKKRESKEEKKPPSKAEKRNPAGYSSQALF